MNELQSKVLELLKEIDQLCRENEIEYYLTAGTLIGAIRHKGFIPWDDDADIIMTRDNWEKFLERTKGKLPSNISLNTLYENDKIAMTANHYVDTNTTAIYRYDVTNPEKNGVMIDVIIMDPVPDNETDKKMYEETLTSYTDLTTLPYQYSIRIGQNTKFSYYWTLSCLFGKGKVLKNITKKAFRFTETESQLYAQRFAGSPHFWKKTSYGKPKYVPFEDTMLPVPERFGECLNLGYDDDWMYVPQNGVTKSTHEFCVRSLTIPGRYIADDFEKRVNRKEITRLYVKKKKIQVSQTENKFKDGLDNYLFSAKRIEFKYKKKLAETNITELLKERNFDALEEFFDDYIKVQCTNHFLGSSALEGWINWYRKCNPCLIDIGDEALYAVLELMMYKHRLSMVGKLLKARKAIDRPLTEKIAGMDVLYKAIKEIRSCYECEENERCRELLNEYLPKFNDNLFLIVLDEKLKIREGLATEKILEETEKHLENFPEDAELLHIKAMSLLEQGNSDEALDLFEYIVSFSNHGLVLLSIKEKLSSMIEKSYEKRLVSLWLETRKQMGEEDLPSIDELFPVEENTSELHSEVSSKESVVVEHQGQIGNIIVEKPIEEETDHILTSVQEKRLQLLIELKKLCDENGVRYYLFGKALLQSARGGEYIDENGDIAVAMDSENCKKFIDVFKNKNIKDRYIDTMAENPAMHRFCLRYGDLSTLDFAVSQCGNERCGIYITVEILRSPAKNKFRNLIDQMLEAGWESRNTMKWTSAKRKISRWTVCTLCTVLGEKRTGKLLFNRFLKGPSKKSNENYYLKPFWGKRTYYPVFWFNYVRNIEFEGNSFTTMKPYSLYLKKIWGVKWKTRTFPLTKFNPFTRVVDADVDSREYLDFLKQEGVNAKKIWKHKQKTNLKYAPVSGLGKKTGYYWDLMEACGHRFRLAEKYIPRKLYILEMFRSNNINGIMRELKDYYDTAVLYSKKGIGLCFDKQVFEILEYCLEVKGKRKQAKTLRKLVPACDWEPINLFEEKKENKMRQAKLDDVPAILTYLKRNIDDCVYMYIDIAKYGLENPNMKVWFDSDDNGITIVVMKYHTSISVFTDVDNWNVEEVSELIRNEGVLSVTGRKDLVEKIHSICNEKYDVSYGYVFNFTDYRVDTIDAEIELATTDDTLEIAKLITTDDGIGSYYEVENLAQQLAERIETGMGRSYVIRNEQGRIIAHIATYAEFNGIATTGGLIVSADCRNGVIGSVMEGFLVRTLRDENFKIYTFVTERLRKRLLTAMGNKCVGEYGKMTLKS